MQYFAFQGDEEGLQNLMKAKGHLERATLDSYKLLWAHLDETISMLIVDPDRRLVGVNLKDEELLTAYRSAKTESLTVRQKELLNIGIDVEDSIRRYSHLIELCDHIMDNVDDIALSMFDARRRRKKCMNYAITLIIGIIGSLIATFIFLSLT